MSTRGLPPFSAHAPTLHPEPIPEMVDVPVAVCGGVSQFGYRHLFPAKLNVGIPRFIGGNRMPEWCAPFCFAKLRTPYRIPSNRIPSRNISSANNISNAPSIRMTTT